MRLPIWYLPSDLTQDAWINVTGTYHYDKHKGMEITVTDIEDAEPSEEEYVYDLTKQGTATVNDILVQNRHPLFLHIAGTRVACPETVSFIRLRPEAF